MQRSRKHCDAVVGFPARDFSATHLAAVQRPLPSVIPAQRHVIISCYQTGVPQPPGFSWANTLVTLFPSQVYTLTLLIHGVCIPNAFTDTAYEALYESGPNPSSGLLQTLNSTYGVSVKLCQLCLTNDGYSNSDLLPFVETVPFSIKYIIDNQIACNAIVVYDPYTLGGL